MTKINSYFRLSISLLSCVCSVFAAEKTDKDLLFAMDYDNFEAAAVYSKGYGKPMNFKGNLMLRMHPGPGQKGNALCYNNGARLESLQRNAQPGLIPPERGPRI